MTLAPVKSGEFPTGAFDVACAFEVVEHVADPKAEAATVADAVREGGLLYVTTPNFDSLSRRLLRANWSIIEYPEHLGYFTATSLSTWLRAAGFNLLELTTTGISPRRLVQGLRRRRSGADATSPQPAAPDDERVREAIESSRMLQAVKGILNATLDVVDAGDTLKARFERRGAEVAR
jgi:SAM-dependent methyltransferase